MSWVATKPPGRSKGFVAALFPSVKQWRLLSRRPDTLRRYLVGFLYFYLNLKFSLYAFCLASCKYSPSNVDVKRHRPVSSADWLAASTAAPGSCGCNLTARLHEDSVMRTTVFILSTRVSVTQCFQRVYTVVFLKRALTRTAVQH